MNAAGEVRARGQCLCGAVRYEIAGPLRDVVLCHCAMCRRVHGHIGAYTAAAKADLRLTEARGLAWYRSSGVAQRGFCAGCGSALFWQRDAADVVSITAGSLDAPTGLRIAQQIYVASAGDYYAIDRDIPCRLQ